MKVKKSDVVSLLVELGTATAANWPVERLQKRLQGLPKLVETEEKTAKSADGKVLLKKIIKAVENEEDIEIMDSTAAAKPAKEEKTPAKSGKKAPKAAKPDEDEEEEAEEEEGEGQEDESEEEDEAEEESSEEDEVEDAEDDSEEESEDESEEEEEKAPKKGKKAKGKKAPPKPKGPTIVGTIRELMEKTSEKKPLKVDDIVAALLKKFPDHEASSLKKTTVGQVSYFLRKTNKNQKNPMNIKHNEKGFYVAG